jgi:predicted nucleic acid-binding protein
VTVVVDSSALITFARIGRLELLRQITGDVHVPDAVFEEVVQKGAGRPGSTEIAQATRGLRRSIRDPTAVDHLRVRVGRGEAETGSQDPTAAWIGNLVAGDRSPGGFVRQVLGRYLDLA